MFSLEPNVCRVIWDGVVHKECAKNPVKYEDVGPDLVTINSSYGLQFTDYSTDICPTYYHHSIYVERTR